MTTKMFGIHCLRPRIAVGESGLGKTTLINTLFATELSPPKNYSRRHVKQLDKLTEVSCPLDSSLARCRTF
jgi:septin family protein